MHTYIVTVDVKQLQGDSLDPSWLFVQPSFLKNFIYIDILPLPNARTGRMDPFFCKHSPRRGEYIGIERLIRGLGKTTKTQATN